MKTLRAILLMICLGLATTIVCMTSNEVVKLRREVDALSQATAVLAQDYFLRQITCPSIDIEILDEEVVQEAPELDD